MHKQLSHIIYLPNKLLVILNLYFVLLNFSPIFKNPFKFFFLHFQLQRAGLFDGTDGSGTTKTTVSMIFFPNETISRSLFILQTAPKK